uniref:Uncharacterized protein n=1 Tax=Odontella aurita TaxID=265563 RepID=A0A7S4J367_9STRA|mmetsp:Transcript_37254/g.111538  ORF Transcript_37254/g.111538 Transcript_37254/m.111538 type:complete len:906 (+) Transcript_37254:604-3321(+)
MKRNCLRRQEEEGHHIVDEEGSQPVIEDYSGISASASARTMPEAPPPNESFVHLPSATAVGSGDGSYGKRSLYGSAAHEQQQKNCTDCGEDDRPPYWSGNDGGDYDFGQTQSTCYGKDVGRDGGDGERKAPSLLEWQQGQNNHQQQWGQQHSWQTHQIQQQQQEQLLQTRCPAWQAEQQSVQQWKPMQSHVQQAQSQWQVHAPKSEYGWQVSNESQCHEGRCEYPGQRQHQQPHDCGQEGADGLHSNDKGNTSCERKIWCNGYKNDDCNYSNTANRKSSQQCENYQGYVGGGATYSPIVPLPGGKQTATMEREGEEDWSTRAEDAKAHAPAESTTSSSRYYFSQDVEAESCTSYKYRNDNVKTEAESRGSYEFTDENFGLEQDVHSGGSADQREEVSRRRRSEKRGSWNWIEDYDKDDNARCSDDRFNDQTFVFAERELLDAVSGRSEDCWRPAPAFTVGNRRGRKKLESGEASTYVTPPRGGGEISWVLEGSTSGSVAGENYGHGDEGECNEMSFSREDSHERDVTETAKGSAHDDQNSEGHVEEGGSSSHTSSSSLSRKRHHSEQSCAERNDESTTSAASTPPPFAPPPQRRHSSLGRRGDPRMHRAVTIRLSRPEYPLLDTLVEGGFVFTGLRLPGASDRTVRDEDGVMLYQRKNQLNRRIRLAKKKSCGVQRDGVTKTKGGETRTKEKEKEDGSNGSSKGTNQGRGHKGCCPKQRVVECNEVVTGFDERPSMSSPSAFNGNPRQDREEVERAALQNDFEPPLKPLPLISFMEAPAERYEGATFAQSNGGTGTTMTVTATMTETVAAPERNGEDLLLTVAIQEEDGSDVSGRRDEQQEIASSGRASEEGPYLGEVHGLDSASASSVVTVTDCARGVSVGEQGNDDDDPGRQSPRKSSAATAA